MRGMKSFKNVKIFQNVSVVVALLLFAITISFPACDFLKDKKPNVVVIMIDTLRADHLGFNGYERNTSPVIDKFAAENLNCKRNFTPAPWTPAAIASLFTGLYPSAHGMMPPNGRDEAAKKSIRLASGWTTMAELFKNNGYYTEGFSPNPWITEGFGFKQGFDVFPYKERAIAEEVNKYAKASVEKWKKEAADKPLFLYLHYLDPHDPYKPPVPYDTMFSGPLKSAEYPERQVDMIGRYDGEIRYTDAMLGELFDYLKAEKIYDDAIVVLLADHGEQFVEHGSQGHGHNVYTEETFVPLIFKINGKKGEIKELTSIVDIMPTLVDAAGLKNAPKMQGVSVLDDKALTQREGVISEVKRVRHQKGFVDNQENAMVLNFNKDTDLRLGIEKFGPCECPPGAMCKCHVPGTYINPTPESVEFYDLKTDFKQTNPNVQPYIQPSDDKNGFLAVYEGIISEKTTEDTEIKLNDETVNQLRTLGYIQ